MNIPHEHIEFVSKKVRDYRDRFTVKRMLINWITFFQFMIYRLTIPLTCISAISECISKYKCVSKKPEVGWRSTKIAEKKLVDYVNTTNVEFVADPKVLFHSWLIYSYLQIVKLFKGFKQISTRF